MTVFFSRVRRNYLNSQDRVRLICSGIVLLLALVSFTCLLAVIPDAIDKEFSGRIVAPDYVLKHQLLEARVKAGQP